MLFRSEITEAGVRSNVSVGIRYIATWLQGVGAAAIDNLMEDAATAEISRSQVWQWLHNDVVLDTGERVTPALVRRLLEEELDRIKQASGDGDAEQLDRARTLFEQVSLSEDFPDFLTLPGYELLLTGPE